MKLFFDNAFERVVRARDVFSSHTFNGDGMRLRGRNLASLHTPKFAEAYAAGVNSGHNIHADKGVLQIQYRTYMECWAARHGLTLEGDFVCCGVNTGIMPLAICKYLDFNSTGRTFWLFDTFNGIPENQMSLSERPSRIVENESFYSECYDTAVRNFAPYPKAKLVRGTVPETLALADINKVAYLSIDMNIAYPERKAIEHFWPKLSPSAIVILDDYGFEPYAEQKATMDEFAASVGVEVGTLPTGQGIIIKPS